MQQTIDERLEVDFSSMGPDDDMTMRSSDLSARSLLESPLRKSKASAPTSMAYDEKLRKMGSPRKRDELDSSNHQRRNITPQTSLSDLDASTHVCRWLLEE